MTKTNIIRITDGIGSVWNKTLDKTPIRKGREKVIKDYFDLYVKSGIMDFVTKKIRKEFEIPLLPPNDLQLIITPFNEEDTTEEEKSQWYESLPEEKKEMLTNHINLTLHQLYLPKSAFNLFLHFLLYRKTPTHYPFDNTDLLYCLAYGYTFDESLGYTSNEIKGVAKLAHILLQEKQEMISEEDSLTEQEKRQELENVKKQIQLVPLRSAELVEKFKRVTRPLRNLPEDIKIIKMLKKHRRKFKEFDYDETKGKHRLMDTLMTSMRVMEKINPDANPEYLNKDAANFRQQKSRLLKKYPILKDFINTP